ncbi:MAG: DNA-binding transcriptional regulator [Bacteroidales bacterium]|nr:DNA-binding transcriptional regulator [Bacteroidales bacterium]
MLRLLIISDFTEAFPEKLLQGIVRYSRQKKQWTICRMPPAYKKMFGMQGVLKWLIANNADAVIGQFDENDDLKLLTQNGVVVVAQDYKQRFKGIPNITGDYIAQGRMAARFYLDRGFHNFGYFGFKDVCWSDERYEGFRREIEEAGFGNNIYPYTLQKLDQLWFYEKDKLDVWLNSLPKPIGIMACDDNQGINLIGACNIRGVKIPSEISVIGVDNDETLCSMASAPLSSILVDIEDGGYRTAQVIEKMVLNPDSPIEDIVLHPVKIVERLSSAAYATHDTQIQKAIQFIHKNYTKKISVKDVMNEVALSRRLLERRFRDVTGQSIYQHISDLRIKRFAEMLTDTDDQIINIALTLGESDTKSIARRFKQMYGCSPSQWREKNHKK